MRRRIIVSLALIAVVLGAGMGLMAVLVKARTAPEKTETARAPLLVETVKPEPETIREMLVGYGTARADRSARISAQVSGEITQLADDLKPGSEFKKDDELIWIDDRHYRHVLSQARAALASEEAQLAQLDVEEANLQKLIAIVREEFSIQQAELDRVKALRNQELAHSREYDRQRLAVETLRARLQGHENQLALIAPQRSRVEASRDQRRAELAMADLNLKRCIIRAPFDGRVDGLMVEVGELAQAGVPLLSFLDPQLLEVPIELPLSQRDRVWVGATCRLWLDKANPACWKGQVKRVSPSVNQATRTFAVYIEVDNADQSFPLMPGSFVRAKIEGPLLEDVKAIPRQAIRQGRVFIFKDGRASARDIRVERHLADRSVISGLQEDDIVITSNLDALYEGVPVRREEDLAGAPASSPSEPEADPLADQK